jgi:phosphatidylglycerophosphatase A
MNEKEIPGSNSNAVKTASQKLWIVIASGFGSGYSPVAPGTAGTFVGMVLYFIILYIPGYSWVLPFTIILLPISVFTADAAEKIYQRKDPGYITIDEVVGYFITVLFLVPGIKTAVLGFFLFRIFDILKIFPGKKSENVHGGLGVVLDDVIAGIYSNVCIRLFYLFFS